MHYLNHFINPIAHGAKQAMCILHIVEDGVLTC